MAGAQQFVVGWFESAFAGALVLLLAWLALGRVRQPADRISVIVSAIAAVVVVPLLVLFVPLSWRLGIVSTSPAVSIAPVTEPGSSLPGERPMPIVEAPADISSSETAPLPPVTASASSRRPFPTWTYAAFGIVTLYSLGALLLVVERIIGLFRLRALVAASTPSTESLRDAWSRVTDSRRQDVRLLTSNHIETPIAFGWFRPTVVVPRSITEGDAATLRFCLAHEWSHILRGDLKTLSFAGACQYLLWVQPFYWRLLRELRVCQDILADHEATNARRDSIEYSELLVQFAKRQNARPVAGAIAFIDGTSQLSRRIKMLLSDTLALRTRSPRLFCAVITMTALAVAGLLSGVRLAEAKADEKTEQAAAPKPPQADSPPMPAPDKPAELPKELHYAAVVVDQETNKGIPDARVTVRRSLSSQDYKVVEESKHTTDADGRYSFVIPPEQVAERLLYIELDVEHDDYAAKKGFGYSLAMIVKNETLGERPFFEKTSLRPSEPATGT
ncbi:MAG TPA: M56 family metallopeptidase, partial [Caulifigura sp.]|nr:M56 family metallopeptidase [Caulifigura sp.]